MEIAARLKQAARALFPIREQRSLSLDQMADKLGLSIKSLAGKAVTEESAMKVSSVYGCVRVLSESVAGLPLKLKRKITGGSEEAVDHPLYRILKDEPNENDTAYEFNETMSASLELRGNAKARILRDAYGRVKELRFVHPDELRTQKLADGRIVYRDGSRVLMPFDVLHLRNISKDGVDGMSVLAQARESIGVSLATEEHGSRFFGNGAAPGGVIEFPNGTKKEDVEKFMERWKEAHQGSENSYRAAALYGGIKYTSLGVNNEDAQFLATRSFQVEDIARFYGVPLFLLQSTEKTTSWGTGMEQIQLAFLTFTLRPRLIRWEKRMNKVLLTEEEKAAGYFCSFNFDALMRAAFKDRMDGYAIGLTNGIYSINEVRAKEDLNALPSNEGDAHRVPLNTAPSGAQES